MAREAGRAGGPAQRADRRAAPHSPAPCGTGQLAAKHRALGDLREAADRLIDVCLSCPGAGMTGADRYLSPGDAAGATADLLAAAAHIVHAVPGRRDPFGLLQPGPLHQAIGSRRADVKIICQDGMRADIAGGRALRGLASAGALVATAPVPPPAIVIVDRQAALMSVPGGDGSEGAVLVRDSLVAGYLADAMDSFWTAATPLDAAIPSDDKGIPRADRALLRLLAEGMTQQDAARRLHTSVRTVSRRTAELKQKLKATSPLQAGLEAARRGWL